MQQLELRAVLRREQRRALRRPVCVPGEIGGGHEALHSGLHAVSALTGCFQFSAGITSAIQASDRARSRSSIGNRKTAVLCFRMTIAAELAHRVTATAGGDLPPLALERAKMSVASTVAS